MGTPIPSHFIAKINRGLFLWGQLPYCRYNGPGRGGNKRLSLSLSTVDKPKFRINGNANKTKDSPLYGVVLVLGM